MGFCPAPTQSQRWRQCMSENFCDWFDLVHCCYSVVSIHFVCFHQIYITLLWNRNTMSVTVDNARASFKKGYWCLLCKYENTTITISTDSWQSFLSHPLLWRKCTALFHESFQLETTASHLSLGLHFGCERVIQTGPFAHNQCASDSPILKSEFSLGCNFGPNQFTNSFGFTEKCCSVTFKCHCSCLNQDAPHQL